MAFLSYRVSRVFQAASGGSYVVKYNAQVETTESSADVLVELVSLASYSEESPKLRRVAIERVREGAMEALSARGLGAQIRLYDFVIHDVDFKPRELRKVTKECLADALKSSSEPGSSPT